MITLPAEWLQRFVIVGLVALAAYTASAATLVWDGTGFDWNVASSWSTVSNAPTPNPAAKPGVNDIAAFNIESVNTTQEVGMLGPQSVRGLLFTSLGAVRITGSVGGLTPTALTIGASGIYSTGMGIHETNSDVVATLLAPQTWTSDGTPGAVALNLNGPVVMGTHRLTVNGTAGTVFWNTISGSGGMTFSGNGGASLRENNAFTGGVTIDGARVTLFNSCALNSTNPNAVSFGSAGQLALFGNNVTVSALTSAATSTATIANNNPLTTAILTVANANDNLFDGNLTNGSNGGTLAVIKTGSGMLTLTGTSTHSGTTTVAAGALKVNGSLQASVEIQSGGALTGSGSVSTATITSTSVRSGGLLAPGDGIGALSVGNLSLNPGSTIQMQLAGTTAGVTFDRLVVTQGATLGGTLQVVLENSYQPAAGDSYDLLDWGFRNSTFSSVSLPALSSGLTWTTTQLYTTGTITVVGAAGDYNNNGVVDAADYTLYRDVLSTSTSLPNDTTPGTVTAADYTVWQANFGQGGQSAAATVPEPTAIAVVLISLLTTSRIATRSVGRRQIA